ncbi:MAG: cytochrome c [Leptospiraceae bacterium]|jgi:mono/diheme cytochrome c family protein|nr:cytochrome c [Leptospiraceae bacterium]MBK7057686.1 cytochrome c [Leptospiraceae bacterium]MBK9500768.1 cytochrome c [Leptospiraceae bacterium]MBP9164757.1 cytochrome c [Leptospiraceae bacterium]HRG48592.1 cytochrome c [Leptospiraceae bacterium]
MKKNVYQLIFLTVILSLVLNCGKKEEKEEVAAPEVKPAATLDPEVAKGKEAFDINCSSCHGATGAGDGVAAASLNPKPRNYKAPASEWKNGNTEAGVLKTLNEGIKGSPMVAYKHLGDDTLKSLAKYVVHLTKN